MQSSQRTDPAISGQAFDQIDSNWKTFPRPKFLHRHHHHRHRYFHNLNDSYAALRHRDLSR